MLTIDNSSSTKKTIIFRRLWTGTANECFLQAIFWTRSSVFSAQGSYYLQGEPDGKDAEDLCYVRQTHNVLQKWYRKRRRKLSSDILQPWNSSLLFSVGRSSSLELSVTGVEHRGGRKSKLSKDEPFRLVSPVFTSSLNSLISSVLVSVT